MRAMLAVVMLGGVVAMPAVAAPTYLACTISSGGEPAHLNITADEANQIATLEIIETGHVERRPAVFTQTTVTFDSPMSFGDTAYRISRTDLSINAVVSAGQTSVTSSGSCTVQTAPQRAF
jgi:hypothetical protein